MKYIGIIWSWLSQHPIVVNCVILVVGAPFALAQHRSELMNGLDGGYMRTLVLQQQDWMPLELGLPLWPFQGMSDVAFPLNARLVPAYAIQYLIGNGFDPVLSYTLFVIELFLAGVICTPSAGACPCSVGIRLGDGDPLLPGSARSAYYSHDGNSSPLG